MAGDPSPFQLRQAARCLNAGGVIAYPTEGVWGIGCDPLNGEAVTRVLKLKGRAAAKGLILIAAALEQLLPYLAPLAAGERARLEATWPGPVTWLIPAAPDTPPWLSGEHATLAVRVTAHPPAAALCRAFGGALVSTSANPSGLPPAQSALAVRRYFGDAVDFILEGPLGGRKRPSEIRDFASGAVIRPG